MAELTTPRRTKLRPPRLHSDLVPRPRLFARLNGLPTLALVVAPAGYGKTTLVSMWLEQIKLPHAWLSLDIEDNDPLQFLLDAVTALRTLFPTWGEEILALLTATNRPSYSLLGLMVINELDALEQEFVLVLDDAHVITDPVIHEWLARVAAHPPRTLHLVINSRQEVFLPWGLRTRGAVSEIRQGELSFTYAETSGFLEKTLVQPVGTELVTAIMQRSVGWATSIRLFALYLRQHADVSSWDEALGGTEHYVMDYFTEVVFEALPETMHRFLLRTSILERVSGQIGDFLLSAPKPVGAEMLHQLEAEGIFTSALDEEGEWYRYHPLFRRALMQKLETEVPASEIDELYHRAAAWHESRHWYEEAISLLLSGNHVTAAAAVAGRHRHELLDHQDYQRLEHWLALFPAPVVAREIELQLIRAYVAQVQFRLNDLAMILQQIETQLSVVQVDFDQLNEWRGETEALNALMAANRNDGAQAIKSALFALDHIRPNSMIARALALVGVSYGYQMVGELPRGLELIDSAAHTVHIPREIAVLRRLIGHMYVNLVNCDLAAIRDAFPKMLEISKSAGLVTTVAWSHYFYASACYIQNDLPAAEVHFGAVLELEYSAHSICFIHSAIGLAFTQQSRDLPQKAIQALITAEAYAARMQNYQLLEIAQAAGAELALRQGRLEDALKWLGASRNDFALEIAVHFFLPILTPVKVLIASGTAANLAAASIWLARAADLAGRTNNIHLLLQVMVLDAVLAETAGERARALGALTKAVWLAEPNGAQRTFLDHAQLLSLLLDMLEFEGPEHGFVKRVRRGMDIQLGRVTEDKLTLSLSPVTASASRNRPGGQSSPVENVDLRILLTNREMDILGLLLQRLTNKEIARNLGISTETVKGHLVSLFRKLGVKNRRQAIVVAQARGISRDSSIS